jgi:hypothetical protein
MDDVEAAVAPRNRADRTSSTAGEHFGLGSVAAKIIDAPLISQTGLSIW